MEPIIQVQCIRHVYPDKTEVNLCGLDFVVKPGERVVILGPNGAGKTTLLSHILGLLTPTEGTVNVMGLNPSKQFNLLRKNIGVVFQNVDEQIIGPLVYDDIAFTPRNERWKGDQIKKAVKEIACRMGIEDLLNKIPHYLSGGQKKKVALAGAMITNPKLVILDEPFDGLDPKAKSEIIEILNDFNRENGTTFVITTHDINIVPLIADTIYVIHNGQVSAKGTPQEVFKEVDLLKEANLEPPILMELFSRLRKRGWPLSPPNDIEDAEAQLTALFGDRVHGWHSLPMQKTNTGS